MPFMNTRVVALILFVVVAGCGSEAPLTEQQNVPAARAPQKPPDENAALTAIANVHAAQKEFISRYRRYALTYQELLDAFFLKEEPTVTTTGYDVKLRPAADAASYTVLAVPASASPASRHFFSNQTGEIRAEIGKDANAQSPLVTQ
jgi:hypothetical protein